MHLADDNPAFEAVFDLERPRHEAWERCRLDMGNGWFRLPGFPSSDGSFGARAEILESVPQQRVVAQLDGSTARVVIEIDPANASGWPTRIKVSQQSPAAPGPAHRELGQRRFSEAIADFRLYLESGIETPRPKRFDLADLGLQTRATPTILEIVAVEPGSPAQCAGITVGDGVLALDGMRIYDARQLEALVTARFPDHAIDVLIVRAHEKISVQITP